MVGTNTWTHPSGDSLIHQLNVRVIRGKNVMAEDVFCDILMVF